jgi:uncharacterized integral membrane protein
VKLIGRLVLGLIAIVIVTFALANRDPVTLSLWPFAEDVTLPIYMAVLGALVVGLVAGGAISWLPKHRLRRHARSAERRAVSLERAVAAPGPPAPAAALPPARYRPALNDD